MNILTVRPREGFKAPKRKFSYDQINSLPDRMPSFVRVDGLNNHYFAVDGEEYEYVDGQYFRKVQTMRAGDSFGQEALHR